MRRTKIVATIGPASDDTETLVRMVEAGMDVARLNFAHGTLEEQAETAERIRAAANRAGRAVALLQDLPGPKLRLGELRGEVTELRPGDRLTLVCGDTAPGDARRMPVTLPGLAEAVATGDAIYLADGSIRLCVEAVRADSGEIDTVIEIGGPVSSHKGVNIPGDLSTLAAVPERDLGLLSFGTQ